MLPVPFTGSLTTSVQVQTGSGQWANGIRLLRQSPAVANGIRPFIRPIAPAVGTALLAKTALVVGAFAVGYGVGTLLKDALLKPKLRPIDTSQPTLNPASSQTEEDTFVEYTSPIGQTQNYKLRLAVRNTGGIYTSCTSKPDLDVEGKERTEVTYDDAYGGVRIRLGSASETRTCGSRFTPLEQKVVYEVQTRTADGEWSIGTTTKRSNGTGTATDYAFFDSYKGVNTQIERDGVVLPPAPEPGIQPEPLPEVEPETLPQILPLPTRPLPFPKVFPGDPLPDEDPSVVPLPLPEPQPLPVQPAVAPQVQPATQPKETQTTTQAGAIVPKTPKKTAVTPKDVHVFGNSGGRVAGRTMRPTATGIAQEVGRIEQKIAGMNQGFPSLGGLADILRLILGLNELLNSQKDGTTYELNSVCECDPCDETCEEETTTIETEGGYYVDAILSRIDALPQLIQAHKDYRQPVCDERPCLAGDFRTISFISDECSPFGAGRLRKRFRYRSQSGVGLDGLVDHWKDFTWRAGAVCVQHKGASWGTPQCWASSSDEGKRVILHAGGEAGIDPNKVGEWIVSGSNNPRYGVPGTMRVNTKGGYYWITERLDSDARPLVAST